MTDEFKNNFRRLYEERYMFFYLKDRDANPDTGQWVEMLFEKTESILYTKKYTSCYFDNLDEILEKAKKFKEYSNNHRVGIYGRNFDKKELDLLTSF